MKWEIKNRVENKLFIDGVNVIEPWGIETADSSTFFSLEEGIGYRYKIIKQKIYFDEKNYQGEFVAKTHDGKWELKVDDKIIDGSNVYRPAVLLCLEDSLFMGFVIRFRFKKDFFDFAQIEEKNFFHENANIYHQFPSDQILLIGKNIQAKIKMVEGRYSDKFRCYVYARDEKNQWVVHVRLLPIKWEKETIKLCNFWFQTRSIPEFLSKIILKSNRIKKWLWYRSERGQKQCKIIKLINPNAYPLAMLKKGEKIELAVKLELSKISKH